MMTSNGLSEMIREQGPGSYELPPEVDKTRANEIEDLLENNRWRYDQNWWVVVLSVVHWALEADYESYGDKRKHAQDKAADEFNEDLSSIQTWCGAQLFEGDEFQIEQKHIARKWQKMFERLLRNLDGEHPY